VAQTTTSFGARNDSERERCSWTGLNWKGTMMGGNDSPYSTNAPRITHG
jgi:hypothetical protein